MKIKTFQFSPDRAGILVVPKHRDEEIKAKAGGDVITKTNRSAPKKKTCQFALAGLHT